MITEINNKEKKEAGYYCDFYHPDCFVCRWGDLDTEKESFWCCRQRKWVTQEDYLECFNSVKIDDDKES